MFYKLYNQFIRTNVNNYHQYTPIGSIKDNMLPNTDFFKVKYHNSTRFLRQPLFIVFVFILLTLQDFASLCQVHLNSIPFWTTAQSCGESFVLSTFFKSSIWSLLLVVFCFEAFLMAERRWFNNAQLKNWRQGVQFQLQLVGFLFLFLPLYWLVNTSLVLILGPSVKEFIILNAAHLLRQLVFLVFIAINLGVFLTRYGEKRKKARHTLPVRGPLGDVLLPMEEIQYCEKQGRNYIVKTAEQEYRTQLNLQGLEKALHSKYFARINRAVIANLSYVVGYNYWENEKYIVEMGANTTFVVTRKRLVSIKEKIHNLKKY